MSEKRNLQKRALATTHTEPFLNEVQSILAQPESTAKENGVRLKYAGISQIGKGGLSASSRAYGSLLHMLT
jgi:hypothetical protein